MFDNFMFAFIHLKKTLAVLEERDQNAKHFSPFVYFHSMKQGSLFRQYASVSSSTYSENLHSPGSLSGTIQGVARSFMSEELKVSRFCSYVF